jgi:hypothetical protein
MNQVDLAQTQTVRSSRYLIVSAMRHRVQVATPEKRYSLYRHWQSQDWFMR